MANLPDAMGASRDAAAKLTALRTLLSTARELVAGLAADPLLRRVLEAFMALPEQDREPIARVLERDASWRRIVEHTADVTGITVHPNPHASLYVHVFDAGTGQPLEPEPWPRDANVIRLGLERFVHLLPLAFQEDVHAQWGPAARELARASDPELRALAARLAREVLAVLAEVEAERGGTSGG